MRIKRIAVVSVVTFLLGGVCGGAYAYVAHQNGQEDLSLADGLGQVQENVAVAQFVSEQERLRPEGLEESKIATGSKYEGITYNVKPATVSKQDEDSAVEPEAEQEPAEQDKTEKSGGFLSGLLGGKDKTGQDNPADNNADGQQAEQTGIIATQEGSLRVRAQGNMNGKVIGQVDKGDTVQIVSEESGWYQIITSDGLQGYVSAEYVDVTAN